MSENDRERASAVRTRAAGTLILGVVLSMLPMAALAAPSSGTILHQSTPAPAAPRPPGKVLTLPSPRHQPSRSTAKIPVKKIVITGNHLVSTGTLEALVRPVVGHTVTLGRLERVVGRITAAYHKRGYPLAYAYLPAQKIHHGVVKVAVVEPHYDHIAFTGSGPLAPGQARRILGVRAGEPIEGASLDRGLLLLQRTPGVRVQGTLVPGARPATSTLKVHLTGGRRVYGSAGVDNYGSDYTGRTRGRGEVTLADPFGYGARIAANALTSSGGGLHAGGLTLVSPDLWDGLTVGAYGSRSVYRLGGVFASLDQSGSADQVGVDASLPLLLRPGRLVSARLDVLHDRFNESIASVGIRRRSDITLGRLSVDGALAGGPLGGVNTAGVSLTHGVFTPDSAASRRADAAGPNAAGGFWVGELDLSHRQPLPARLRVRVGLSGQMASTNLNSAEQFYLGGPSGVMSYPVGAAGGDAGALLRLRLSHPVPLPAAGGDLSAALLAQTGTVWVNHHVYPAFTGDNRRDLSGAGVGLHYAWRHRVQARVAYVRQLGATRPGVAVGHHGELWASARVLF